MTAEQKLKSLKEFVSCTIAGQQFEFKPFLRTYTIVPDDDRYFLVYDTDGYLISALSELRHICRFILSGGDTHELK